MFKTGNKDRGIVLFYVLALLLIMTILASVILNIMSSQSGLSEHKSNRIKAYYAALAGINYARERLMLNNDGNPVNDDPLWPTTGTYSRTICKAGCDVIDLDFPASIRKITVNVEDLHTGVGDTRRFRTTVSYQR